MKTGAKTEEIILPGRVEAWHEAPIYARTSGYVAKWTTDIGAHVKAGDVLAEIDTPEIDAQLRQMEAAVETANADNKLAQSTASRWKGLLKTDSVTKQEADEKTGDAASKEALAAAARANLDRLKDLEAFKRIVAPFDGVISARNVDTGTLVNAGSGQQELFHMVEKDKLRIYVEVPQNYTERLKPGLTAELHFAEHPDKTWQATLSGDASALDSVTRTLRVQFAVDNADEALLPGGYTEVHLQVPSDADGARLPVNTLLFRTGGVFVAVANGGHAEIRKLTLGRDFGTEVEVKAGLAPDDAVIVNPSDSLSDNAPVKVAAEEPAAAAKDAKKP